MSTFSTERQQRIDRSPDVCGGAARIRGTRVEVWLLESFRRQGISNADLLEAYPFLEAADLESAWEYAKQFPAEIESAIQANR